MADADRSPRPEPDPAPIILFDGVCALCHRCVRFVLRWESSPRMTFASLQSPVGISILEARGLTRDMSTLVLIEGECVSTKSDAVLRMLRYLRAGWSWMRVVAVIPRPIRDWIYDRVAAHRYRIFGRTDTCSVPPATMAGRRFLDAVEED